MSRVDVVIAAPEIERVTGKVVAMNVVRAEPAGVVLQTGLLLIPEVEPRPRIPWGTRPVARGSPWGTEARTVRSQATASGPPSRRRRRGVDAAAGPRPGPARRRAPRAGR